MTGRPEWYYGKHPPACTCAACTERRLRVLESRNIWQRLKRFLSRLVGR